MKLQCIVVDDEPLAIDVIVNYIEKIPFLVLAGTFNNPLDALPLIQKENVDIVFLDIQMPELTGMQFLKLMRGKAGVIIVSAYSEYAIDGYEHDVLDYLLKPVSFDRFYKAVQKAATPRESRETRSVEKSITTPDFIFIKVDSKLVKIFLDDILYIEGLKNYVSIYTKTERYITLQLMKQLEDVLPFNRFVRVHKSYVVAIDKISSIERQEIHINKVIIPIGATFSEHFAKMLKSRKA